MHISEDILERLEAAKHMCGEHRGVLGGREARYYKFLIFTKCSFTL